MAEKVTYMELKVDLQCSKCYKKVKKVLCKIPQIQDQVYDEKNNTVKIKVVCCSPEKIRDKICCKGGGSIESIEILKPPKSPKPADKKKSPGAPKPAKKPKKDEGDDPDDTVQRPITGPIDSPPKADKPKAQPAEPRKPDLPPPPGPLGPVPVGFCCIVCYRGHGGGPCYNPCYGQPLRYYDGYYGRPVYDSWGGGGGYGGYYGKSCGECFSDENPQGCTIM